MNFRAVIRFLGVVWLALGAAMWLSTLPWLWFRDGGAGVLLQVGGACAVIGAAALLATRGAGELPIRGALLSVACAWVSVGLLGALPYYLSGLLNFTDALFESVSGLTTTGATVINDVESLPHAILLWRSMTHTLGGMGIVVMSVALLPLLGYGGVELFQTEAVGPLKSKLTPQVRTTARILWSIYLGLIALETGLLVLGGMTLFDAVCHAMGTVATGGFSTKNASLAYYQSTYLNTVVTVFMIAGGANFSLHFFALSGQPLVYLRDIEFRTWLIFIVACSLVAGSVNWLQSRIPLGAAVERTVFSVVSMVTTTGFTIDDFDQWAYMPKYIILILTFVGACAGSTGGSVKMSRWVVAMRAARVQLKRNIHPQAVFTVRMNDRPLSDELVKSILLFIVTYIGMVAFGALALTAMGMDWETALGGTAACASSCGPGFGALGATETYAAVPAAGKCVLIVEMLLGRLEIYSILVIFTRGFWKP